MLHSHSLTRLLPCVLLSGLTFVGAAEAQEEEPKHRRVAGIRDVTGSVSSDGRYYAFTNWQTGQLGIKDLTTGEDRYIVTPESGDEYPYAARFAPDGRRIAYTWTNEDGSAELRVVNADGTGVRTLQRGGEAHGWSPDGNHVLAVVDGSTVLVSVSDGSIKVLRTSDWRFPLEMRFSPDGRHIAYDLPLRADSPERDIFLLGVEEGREIPIVEAPGIDRVLDWTPDGKRLLFDSDRGLPPGTDRRAWLINVADGRPIGEPVLVEPEIHVGRGLGFSHDGAYYYCCGGWEPTSLYVASIDPPSDEHGAPKMITSGLGGVVDWSLDARSLAYGWHSWPFGLRWSPDGRSLLVLGRDLGDRFGIYRIDADTGEATPIVQGCCVRSPTWSPEGDVIFVSWQGSGDTVRVVSRDPDTGAERELHRMPPPAYPSQLAASPDGQWLAYFWSDVPAWSFDQGQWALRIMPLGGGESRELARLSVQARRILKWGASPSLDWSPDSRHLIYAINAVTDGQPAVTLWRIAAEGGGPENLGPAMEGVQLFSLSIHPDGRQMAFTGRYLDQIPDAFEYMWVLEDFLPASEDRESAGRKPNSGSKRR
jgi:Tol biopolymer transport system component